MLANNLRRIFAHTVFSQLFLTVSTVTILLQSVGFYCFLEFFFFNSGITHLNRKFTVTRHFIPWCVWESTSKNLLQSQINEY